MLIERFEHGLPSLVTKDGVTVFRSLGFEDAAAHCVMETARDASVRTASEAGDGTTTSAILSEALVRNIDLFCSENRRVSPQRVVRHLESAFRDFVEPGIKMLSKKALLDDDAGKSLLHAVARVSANGDTDLADAVIKCFEVTGDEGNVTIVESNGQSRYEVEEIKGFAIGMGYEESCAKFYAKFINDPGRQLCQLENPIFLLYHGRISEIQTLIPLMERIGLDWGNDPQSPHNVVVVATGFSETVLGNLAANFAMDNTINVFPLLAPMSPQSNGQLQFLMDLAAITGSKILDPLNTPIEFATIEDLGPGVEAFEASRFRSSVIGHADPELVIMRTDELRNALENPESELDAILIRERMAKITGGIAKLRVIGASNGELKEKRDRAEDAVCAVRGAIKHGFLPGGAWTLLKLCNLMPSHPITDNVLKTAFVEPFNRLLQNCGVIDEAEARDIMGPILEGIRDGKAVVFDFLEQKHGDAYEMGILDSTPAVLEAIRTSISIASQLGTTGGIIAFGRDLQLEREEAKATSSFLRNLAVNEANERP